MYSIVLMMSLSQGAAAPGLSDELSVPGKESLLKASTELNRCGRGGRRGRGSCGSCGGYGASVYGGCYSSSGGRAYGGGMYSRPAGYYSGSPYSEGTPYYGVTPTWDETGAYGWDGTRWWPRSYFYGQFGSDPSRGDFRGGQDMNRPREQMAPRDRDQNMRPGERTPGTDRAPGTKRPVPSGTPAPSGAPDKTPGEKESSLGLAPITLVINLPAGARLTIEDQPTRSNSAKRTFVSPPLPVGKLYVYTLKMTGPAGETATKEITVRAGEQREVTLDFSVARAAR